jgi:hypothetical protein
MENLQNLQKLLENIADSRQIIKNATGGESQGIAYGVGLFGKRVSARWIRSLSEDGDHKKYAFQENYKRILGGWFHGCRAGAELLITDMEIFIREARRVFQTPFASERPMLSNVAARDLILIRNTVDGLLAY